MDRSWVAGVLLAFCSLTASVAWANALSLPAGRDAVRLPFLFESEPGDPAGLLLSDREAFVGLGWDETALHVSVEALDEVRPGDGVTVRIGEREFAFDIRGAKRFEASVPWTDAGLAAADGTKFRLDVLRTRAAGVRGADQLGGTDVVLKRAASGWGFSNPIHLGDTWFDTKFRFNAAADGKAQLFFVVRGTRPLNFVLNTPFGVRSGRTSEMALTGGSMDRGILLMRVTDADGSQIFSGDWNFRKNAPLALRVFRSDVARDLLKLETDNRIGPDEDYRVRLTMKDRKDGAVVWEKTAPAVRCRGITNEVFDVSDLKPGCYNAHYAFLAPDGRVIDEGLRYYAKEDGRAPWSGIALGAEDEVPAPWTNPVAEDGAFSCWGRKMALGGAGLVTSLVSQGREALKDPVAVVLNGRRLAFASTCVKRRNAGADYRLTAEGAPVSAALSAEFDGFLWFDLTWGGKPSEEVRSLDIEIPLDRANLSGLEVGPGGFFRTFGATNAVWKVDPTQLPCLWIGDGLTGLMAGVDSIRGTHLKDPSGAFEIRVGPDAASVVFHLVDTPFRAEAPRTFGFYLEGTPSHPKNNALAMIPREKVRSWTGAVGSCFDATMEGFVNEEKCARFRRGQEQGENVYYYFAVQGTSPYQPWWGRFGDAWTRFGDPALWYDETKERPSDERRNRELGSWLWTCLGDGDFADFKLWTIDWFLNEGRYKAENLYFDLAQPGRCRTPWHRCCWTDDFGRRRTSWDVKEVRELNLRAYRLLKRKNPEGTIFGHSGTFRGPSDVFFDRMVRGENYCDAVARKESYYDILNPEDMQVKYASRSNEYVIDMLPQIVRGMIMCGKQEKVKNYDPLAPEEDRAIRHATAYFKIHDLLVATGVDGRNDGPQWQVVEKYIASMGATRDYRAYYHPDCPVTVSAPDRLFLYAWFRGAGKTLLILLNDTDADKAETVSVKGLAGIGRDLFGKGTCDLTSGGCTLTLGPRESRFFAFCESNGKNITQGGN